MSRFLVTGAARGIGREITELLTADHHVIALGRNRQSLATTSAAETVIADLAQPELLESNEALLSALGSLDGIVHCAGLAVRSSVATSTVASWQRLMTVNVVAVSELTRLALPALRAARGTVVFVNSAQGLSASAGSTVYAATKFALRSLAQSMRGEEPDVRVCSVYPGRVATEMQEELRAQEGLPYEPHMYIQPRTVAEAVVSALTAPAESMITEVTIRPRVPS